MLLPELFKSLEDQAAKDDSQPEQPLENSQLIDMNHQEILDFVHGDQSMPEESVVAAGGQPMPDMFAEDDNDGPITSAFLSSPKKGKEDEPSALDAVNTYDEEHTDETGEQEEVGATCPACKQPADLVLETPLVKDGVDDNGGPITSAFLNGPREGSEDLTPDLEAVFTSVGERTHKKGKQEDLAAHPGQVAYGGADEEQVLGKQGQREGKKRRITKPLGRPSKAKKLDKAEQASEKTEAGVDKAQQATEKATNVEGDSDTDAEVWSFLVVQQNLQRKRALEETLVDLTKKDDMLGCAVTKSHLDRVRGILDMSTPEIYFSVFWVRKWAHRGPGGV